MSEPVKTRRYNSPRRLQQAAATRIEILQSAQRLFERDGYATTTVAAIAADAGVALKTVYFVFETKSGVLRALWNVLLRGDDGDAPVVARRWYREALDEPDPQRQLRLVARNSSHVKQRIGAILEVIRAAAPTDPDIHGLWQKIQTDFHANQQAIAESLEEKNALAGGIDSRRATDILWALNLSNLWQLLISERGWTPGEYERLIGDLACAQLLNQSRPGTNLLNQSRPGTNPLDKRARTDRP
jgi:AcrR family transcriptional regulator